MYSGTRLTELESKNIFARIEILGFGYAFILIADPYQISMKAEVTEVL
jgi:hypothetical protein